MCIYSVNGFLSYCSPHKIRIKIRNPTLDSTGWFSLGCMSCSRLSANQVNQLRLGCLLQCARWMCPLPVQQAPVLDSANYVSHLLKLAVNKLTIRTRDFEKTTESVGIEDFEVLKVVGEGAFAKVYQVRKMGTSEIYAMKVMRKDRIMYEYQADDIKFEKEILSKIDHPYIIKLRYSFQTKYRLYLVLDFVNGGELFFQLRHHGLFREELARIYAAEIVSAVSHLHANGIMHRDIKPGNILLDTDGHAMLTDFGLAKQFDQNTRCNSFCGTLEYMAPELVEGKKAGYDKAADWWSVGVLLFEMLTGEPPFTGNRQKIQQNIVSGRAKLPSFLSSEAHSLLKGLLQKDASKRLGSSRDDIKRHKWFKPINWEKLDARKIQPSFRPAVNGPHCVANFDKCLTEMSFVDSPAASPNNAYGKSFSGFSYIC